MPNAFAYFVLFSWPIAAFLISKKMSLQEAAFLLLFIPFLFLPEKTGVDLPLVPSLDKDSIPSLVAVAVVIWGFKVKGLFSLPDTFMLKLLTFSLFLYPVCSLLTNTQSYQVVDRYMQGMGFSDFLSLEFTAFCTFLIPFVLGRQLLSNAEGHRIILKYSVVYGLIYSVLMLWEIRMSPQLHSKLYGFFPHDFAQQMRGGGFRPVVFQVHGLSVALLCCNWILLAAALSRAKDAVLKGWGKWVVVYFVVVLILCKSLGALVLALLFLPVILILSPKKQIQVASVLALIVIIYPLLRAEQIIPIHDIVDSINSYDSERGQSFEFRVKNEEMLLEKASEKRFFGWGSWGRNRVFDPDTGVDLSVTDGFWVSILGMNGWFGYLTVFGLLGYPIIRLRRLIVREGFTPSFYTSGVACVLIVNLINLLPNASFSAITVLLAGSLCGTKSSMEGTDQSIKVENP